jgi:hypothetical protein
MRRKKEHGCDRYPAEVCHRIVVAGVDAAPSRGS